MTKSDIQTSWRPRLPSGKKCGRDPVRQMIYQALIDGVAVSKDLPPGECKGARKTYLAPGVHPKAEQNAEIRQIPAN